MSPRAWASCATFTLIEQIGYIILGKINVNKNSLSIGLEIILYRQKIRTYQNYYKMFNHRIALCPQGHEPRVQLLHLSNK